MYILFLKKLIFTVEIITYVPVIYILTQPHYIIVFWVQTVEPTCGT